MFWNEFVKEIRKQHPDVLDAQIRSVVKKKELGEFVKARLTKYSTGDVRAVVEEIGETT